jgi:signal transduction histidine kinase
VTKARATDKEALQAVREILRRAGHELRNALSGVAVNIEVVRSRLERDGQSKDLTSFADRARLQVGVATSLTDGVLALVSAVLAAEADGTLKSGSGHGAETQTELMIYGDSADTLASDIERLANQVGVSVERRDQRVILKVLPEGKSHSKD